MLSIVCSHKCLFALFPINLQLENYSNCTCIFSSIIPYEQEFIPWNCSSVALHIAITYYTRTSVFRWKFKYCSKNMWIGFLKSSRICMLQMPTQIKTYLQRINRAENWKTNRILWSFLIIWNNSSIFFRYTKHTTIHCDF